ncbi:hypothetical protein KA071_00255 [Candidatus Gracilibacteria bacterium]|nr:hypothetical protein [Candidatus Gracilibacteria bacterium]
MPPKKNILLFRGDNKETLRTTLQKWREKFIEKHGEMNLLEMRNDNIFDGVLGDCLAPGFMGGTRMIIFYEKLIKTAREQEKIEEQTRAEETINLDDLLENGGKRKNPEDDTVWISTLEKIPDTNFILFVGNKKPVTDLEKWLEKNASLHEFQALSVDGIISYIESTLRLPSDQAMKMSDRLGNNYEFVIQEVKKLSLAYQARWSDEELKSILPDYRDENAFNMLDPLWNRDPFSMIKIWGRLMETADHELTMAMMITMMRKILIAAHFNRINNLPITPGQKSTGKRLLSHKKALKKLYDDIVAVDIAEKSGELPNKTNAFLMALLSFC